MRRPLLLVALLGCGLVACGDDPASDPGQLPYDRLSDYGFFVGPLAEQQPADGVVPYVPISPLWADHAGKGRYIVLPEGRAIDPVGDEDWDYPIGTIIVKTFFLSEDRRDPEGPARIVETRLLVREDTDERWGAYTYRWNDEQTDAERLIAGARLTFDIVDETGSPSEHVYVVPNENQCRDCHARDDVSVILGINTVQLDFEVEVGGRTVDQLEWLSDQGVFTRTPERALPVLASPTDEAAPVADRARAYLHANCAHCHRPGGDGGRSGLDLRGWQDEPSRFGVCKSPVAAGSGAGGRHYDIVPGDPDASIIPFRMASVDSEIRMPELPSRIPDDFGVGLVREWIASMPGRSCD